MARYNTLNSLNRDWFIFDKFPDIDYDIEGDGNHITVKNILRHFKFRPELVNNTSVFTKWTIRDEDNPWVIADKLYNDSLHFWIVLLANDLMNPYFDWPMNEKQLKNFITQKYGENNIHSHHHYRALKPVGFNDFPEKTICDEFYQNKESVSNYDYEMEKNESKRQIKLIHPDYLSGILLEVKELINGWRKP